MAVAAAPRLQPDGVVHVVVAVVVPCEQMVTPTPMHPGAGTSPDVVAVIVPEVPVAVPSVAHTGVPPEVSPRSYRVTPNESSAAVLPVAEPVNAGAPSDPVATFR